MLIYEFLSSEMSHINFNKEEEEIISLINKHKVESITLADIKYLVYNSYLYNKLIVLSFIQNEFKHLFDKANQEDKGIQLVLNFNY